MGTLYLVATPIGNLEDISQRALNTLEKARLIAAEDTRQTRKLLDHYKIRTPAISYHEHNKLTRIANVLSALSQGDVALVSDAGTPALNDPGYELVVAALEAGYLVSPIPGASAPMAALVASGLPTDAFLYLGYLPRKSNERKSLLHRFHGFEYTLIFLESPHRLVDSLKDIQSVLGNRKLAVARELTKLHEEIFRGQVGDAINHFSPQSIRGEITLVIDGNRSPQVWSEDEVEQALHSAIRCGASPSETAAEVASLSGWPRRKLYRMIMTIQSQEQKGDTKS